MRGLESEMASPYPTHSGPSVGVRITTRQALYNYLSSVAGTYVFLALSFVTSVYLTRSLGAGGFGQLTLLFAVAQTALLLAVFWTHAGFLRYGAEEMAIEGTLRRVFWGRMLVVTPTVVAFIALGWKFRVEIGGFHGVVEVGYWDLVLYFLTLFLSQMFQTVYQAHGRAGGFAFLLAGERALILGGFLVMHIHLRTHPPLGMILFTFIAAEAAVSLAAYLLLDSNDFLPVSTSVQTVRRLMIFSWPGLIGVFGSYFTSNWLDVVIIQHFLGSGSVGQYGLAYQLMGAVQQIPMLSFPVLVPLLVGFYVSDRNASIQLYLDRVVPHAVFAMGIMLSTAILIAAPLVSAVFGQQFAESARALPVLLLAVGWYCMFIAYIPILNLRERTRSILAASGAAAAANLLGNLLLIPAWGIVGAAWATVLSQSAGALVVAWMVKRDYRVSLLPILLVLVPVAIVALSVTLWRGWTPAVLAGGIAAFLFVIIARALLLFSEPDRRLLASLNLPGLRWFSPVSVRENIL